MNDISNPSPKASVYDSAYINGNWVKAASGATYPVSNPASGEMLARVPDMNAEDTREAIRAAHAAQPGWRSMTAKERSAILKRWHRLVVDHVDHLAEIMTSEQGKPLAEAKGEVMFGASYIEWYAEEAKRVYGDIIPEYAPDRRILVQKQPIGVVFAVTPWNFPSAMIPRKCAPALAAGCTVVLKPAEATPLSGLALVKLAEEAGFPAGAFNVITTNTPSLVGDEATANPLVSKVSFTGSTAVGKLLMKRCADTVKKVTLELGGHAPFIVFNDADIDAAVDGAIASKFRTAGQTCVCANRFLVEDGVYDVFVEKFTAAARKLNVGNGFQPGVDLGPLINEKAIEKVQRHVDDAVTKGARLLCGGERQTSSGTFYPPTVLSNVTDDMIVTQEETFGPIAPVMKFSGEADAIRIANDTRYGLAAYVYSRDIGRVWRVADALEAGSVGVNTGVMSTEVAPAGGMKESGIGREGSMYGIDDFLELKYICMAGLEK